jgi:hypothetical protein
MKRLRYWLAMERQRDTERCLPWMQRPWWQRVMIDALYLRVPRWEASVSNV